MSKTTIAIIAAASAASGATIASIFCSRKPDSTPTSSQSPTGTTTAEAAAAASAASAQLLQKPPVDPTGLFQYGFPGPQNDLHPSPPLVSSFDRRTRNPSWVAEHITPHSLSLSNGNRRYSTFYEDPTLPTKFRAKLSDYARSGYDRGHQVPAADAKWSQEAMNSTFCLSNMCPQVGDGFNRDYWAHLEDFCRRLTHRYPSVRIVTGPLYLPRRDPEDGKWRVSYEVIGSPANVAVPTHFFKVIFAEEGRGGQPTPGGPVALAAFVLPNAPIANDKPLLDFEVPLDIVERASGLEFATKLPETRRRRLCKDHDCSLVVKEYAERQKAFGSQAKR